MSPPPARSRTYFLTTKAKEWSIRDYFTLNASTLKEPDGFESLVRTWIMSLTSFANDQGSSSSKRKIAKRLLESYTKKGNDFREARMMRAVLTSMPAAEPSIVVNGDNAFSNSTIVNGDNTLANASINGAPLVLPSAAAIIEESTPTVHQTRQSTLKRKTKAPPPRRNTSSSSHASRFVQSFEDAFDGMLTDKKWYLPSAVCVEDTLYECFKGVTEESAVHSWIIDIKDDNTKACFTTEDWQVICDAMPPPPAPDETMAHSMCRYMGIKTADQLQQYLDNNPPFEPDEANAITPDQRRGRRWVDGIIRAWSVLLQDPTVFVRKHNENWYTCRFWTEAIDKCLSTIDGGYMSRGETKSMCTSNRKNTQPPAGKRRRVGHLYDGLVTINSHEVAVVEHGREFIGENGKKWGSDTLKVIKLLHDMLYELQSRVVSPEVLRQLQVVGVVSAGWRYQVMRMAYVDGHICVLSTDEELKVPSDIAEFSALHTQLVDLWGYRELLNTCYRDVINGSLLEPEQRMERMLMSPAHRGMKTTVIPRSVETDDGGVGVCDDTDDNDEESG